MKNDQAAGVVVQVLDQVDQATSSTPIRNSQNETSQPQIIDNLQSSSSMIHYSLNINIDANQLNLL